MNALSHDHWCGYSDGLGSVLSVRQLPSSTRMARCASAESVQARKLRVKRGGVRCEQTSWASCRARSSAESGGTPQGCARTCFQRAPRP